MENLLNRVYGSFFRHYRILLTALAMIGFIGAFVGAQSAVGVQSANCVLVSLISAYQTVQTAIFVVGILLMILGGALYAGAHIMPGQTKGTIQGYSMGMIMGGIIGVIIAILAPYIFSVITGTSPSTYTNTSSLVATGC